MVRAAAARDPVDAGGAVSRVGSTGLRRSRTRLWCSVYQLWRDGGGRRARRLRRAPLYGYALADANCGATGANVVAGGAAIELADWRSRRSSLTRSRSGRSCWCWFVLAGNFMRSEAGFDLNWQLLDIPTQSVKAGGSINVESFRT